MHKQVWVFQESIHPKSTQIWLNHPQNVLDRLVAKQQTIFLVDDKLPNCKELFPNHQKLYLAAGESLKTWENTQIYAEKLLSMLMDRGTMLVGVGGGTVTDFTGFLGAILLRGIKVGFIPTTLLAQVDASLGGKNGINSAMAKNLIGTITAPHFIWVDQNYLKSQATVDYLDGMAEVIKYACILDEHLMQLLEQRADPIINQDASMLSEVISCCIEHKMKIVQEDIKEKGNRKILNFGHTFGHAIERVYQYTHGQAISIGMRLAAELSLMLGTGITNEQVQRISNLLAKYQLPIRFNHGLSEVWDVLFYDKKKEADHIAFILLEAIGKPVIIKIPHEQIQRLMEEAVKRMNN